MINKIDIAVVGGGHAGCEAALASARMGMKTVLFAISLDSIAMMPCNPSIGGSSKGHLVKEIDALGGEMGKNIDKTYIQTKMLNTGKGPAVYSLRAQADKVRYQAEMKHTLEKIQNLHIRQDEIVEILVEDVKIKEGNANSYNMYFSFTPSNDLKEIQTQLYNMTKNEKFNPITYTPHISIHTDKDYNKLTEMRNIIMQNFEPFTISFDKIGLFEIYPAKKVL